jgi:hypothetical protein
MLPSTRHCSCRAGSGRRRSTAFPAELIAAGLLHRTAACVLGVPAPARMAMRALGDGALAATALSLGSKLGSGPRHRMSKAKPAKHPALTLRCQPAVRRLVGGRGWRLRAGLLRTSASE